MLQLSFVYILYVKHRVDVTVRIFIVELDARIICIYIFLKLQPLIFNVATDRPIKKF